MTEQAQAQPESHSFRLGPATLILTVLALLAAVTAITAEIMGADALAYALKPTTMILIIAVALLSRDAPAGLYKWAIIAGLVFSLAGDILLMLPQDLFLLGLIAFAVAQLAYTGAFISVGGFYRSFRAAVPFLLFGIFMASLMWVGLQEDGMVVPALAYLVIILIMAWQSYGHWRQTGETRSMLAFAGVLLFVTSDSFLAVNRFLYDLEDLAPILVLGSYYPAQWLIAQSVGRQHP